MRTIGAPRNRQWLVAWRAQYYFVLRAAVLRGFAAVPVSAGGVAGVSPRTPLSGQILKAGHFLQPATMAIGQMVMVIPVVGKDDAAV